MSGLTGCCVDMKVKQRRITMFAKLNDPDSQKAKEIFDKYYLPKDVYEVIDIEKRQDCKQLENHLRYICLTDRRKSPYIFIDHLYFGSFSELNYCHQNGLLKQILS